MKSTNKIKYDRLFNEILEIFFNREEINKFRKIVANKKIKQKKESQNTTKKVKSQMEIEFNTLPEIQKQIDLLITFASEKLQRDKFLSLTQSLGQYCITIGELNSAIAIYEKLLYETKKDSKSSSLKAEAYISLAEIYRRKAEMEMSFSFTRKATLIYKKLLDKKGLATCENLKGTIYGELGNFGKAKKCFEKSLSLCNRKRDIDFVGRVEINLGVINEILGKYEDALSYFNRALIGYQKISNHKRIAEIQHNIGMMHANSGRPKSAIKEFDKSINTCMKIGYLPLLGISYLGKSLIFSKQEDFSLAEAFANKAMQICHKIDDKLSIADVYKIKGIINRDMKNFEKAENYLQTSLRINREIGNRLNEAETSFELGLLYKYQGNNETCKMKFNDALKYYKSLKAEPRISDIKKHMKNLSIA